MAWTRSQKIAAATVIVAVFAALPAYFALRRGDSPSGDNNVGGTVDGDNVGGDNMGGDNVGGDKITNNYPPAPTPTLPDPLNEEYEERRGDDPPTGAPPYGFVVKDTDGQGLFIRDGFLDPKRSFRLPNEPVFQTGEDIWVDCQVTDGWDPRDGTGGGPVWYKVRWPSVSEAGDTWVYAGWTVPNFHNGQVPLCSSAQRGE